MLQRYLQQYRKYFSKSSKINKIEKNFKIACTYILQAYKDQEIHIATSYFSVQYYEYRYISFHAY